MNSEGYEEVHDGGGFERRDIECDRILEFAVAHKLVVSNCFFTKTGSKTNWLHPGQVTERKLVLDIKAIPNEECVT